MAPWVRFAYVIGFITVSVIIAIFASDDFISDFKNFVLLLLMVFIPWSSKGRYGARNVPALLTYALGIVVQIPFLAQTLHTGLMTELLGGADSSWLVGLVVTAVVHYPVAKRFSHPPAEMVYPAVGTSVVEPVIGTPSPNA